MLMISTKKSCIKTLQSIAVLDIQKLINYIMLIFVSAVFAGIFGNKLAAFGTSKTVRFL